MNKKNLRNIAKNANWTNFNQYCLNNKNIHHRYFFVYLKFVQGNLSLWFLTVQTIERANLVQVLLATLIL